MASHVFYVPLTDLLDRAPTGSVPETRLFASRAGTSRCATVRVVEQATTATQREPCARRGAYKTRPSSIPAARRTRSRAKEKFGSGGRDQHQQEEEDEIDGGGDGVGGEGGGRAAWRVRGAGGCGGASGGAEHADGDGAARQEEGHCQGCAGPLGAGDGGRRGGGVPPAAAAQVLVPWPALRREPRLLPEQQGSGLDLPPARQGVRVHDVRDDGGGGAGVHDRAGGRARGAVDQALQHLHPLLRADRRQPRARDARRRRHGRRLRGIGAQRLPSLLVGAEALRRRPLSVSPWRQLLNELQQQKL